MGDLFSYLNEEQAQAVISDKKYLQITAGPGTGKTTTIAAKMLFLLSEKGVSTDDILAISFSRAAKYQLIKKIDDLSDILGYGGKPPILTFHSLAFRTIKFGIHYEESRYRSGFNIIHTEEFLNFSQDLIKGLCPQYTDRDLVNSALSNAYNLIRQGNKLEEQPLNDWKLIPKDRTYYINMFQHGRILITSNDLVAFWKRISVIEKIKNVTDYQGLLTEATRLLKLKSHTLHKITSTFQHLFVDEYQDTSLAQEAFMYSLLQPHHSLTVVGDKNQTIYTFNGSNSKNMDRFINHFSAYDPNNFDFVNLVKNYRSTENIIQLANHFIEDSSIKPGNPRNGLAPHVVETHSIDLAAKFIAKKVKDLIENEGVSPGDICILYRKNSEYSPQRTSVLEQLSLHENLPVSSISGKINSESLLSRILKIKDIYEDEPLDEVISLLNDKDDSIVNFIKEAMEQGAYDTDDLTDYIVEVQENYQVEEEDSSITIKTVHDAKGLEFPIVFVLYLGDREFPHSSQPDIEEEKRLLYVALTRAKDQLYVIGKRGYEFESFLDKCLYSNVIHERFHSEVNEEHSSGVSEDDKLLIDQTTKELEILEKEQQEELEKLMELL